MLFLEFLISFSRGFSGMRIFMGFAGFLPLFLGYLPNNNVKKILNIPKMGELGSKKAILDCFREKIKCRDPS